ncbi:MAG: hypothetical protein ACLU9S_14465 [Oscillospiraceae bacterium]
MIPIEIANNLKKNGGFIPGFRPGKPTADFIAEGDQQDYASLALMYLAIVAILPIIAGNHHPAYTRSGDRRHVRHHRGRCCA